MIRWHDYPGFPEDTFHVGVFSDKDWPEERKRILTIHPDWDMFLNVTLKPGWYWLPYYRADNSPEGDDPEGPFLTEEEALKDAVWEHEE